MPQIQKQMPPRTAPARPKPSANGSVLSGAIPINEIGDDYLKMTIYGRNRVGKTTLACQFPKPLLLISFEPAKSGGARSVKRVPGVDYLRITSSRQAFQLAEELESNTNYKTHVLDTVTSYQDLILQEVIGKPTPEQLDWGEISRYQYRDRSSKTKEALRPFLNLNAHTVLLAQEKDHNPQDKEVPKIIRTLAQESFFASDLGAAAVAWLHDACDYICQLYLDKEIRRWTEERKVAGPGNNTKKVEFEEETGRLVRRLRSMYHPNFAAGFRSENPESVPEYIEGTSPANMYAKIMAVISGIKQVGGK